MHRLQIVIDTNVLLAGLRSPRGASYQVLRLLAGGYFDVNISVPLVLEYESIAKRYLDDLPINAQDVEELIDYVCTIAHAHEVHYTWRPFLPDPNDEMILELAVSASCDAIVTFNKRDFRGCEQFGLRLLTPVELLQEIGVLK
ncbi:MAG: putative toxin-antitoxin system toxin component, PIN family [Caldilineaceae bacterium]